MTFLLSAWSFVLLGGVLWAVGDLAYALLPRRWGGGLSGEISKFFAGALLIAALQGICLCFPPQIGFAVAIGSCFVCGCWGIHRRRVIKAIWVSIEQCWRWEALLSLMLIAGSLYASSISAYPGPFSAGYGDMAAYCRIVQRMALGGQPFNDALNGIFPGGSYALPFAFPVPVLDSAFFTTLFPSLVFSFLSAFSLLPCLLLFVAVLQVMRHYLLPRGAAIFLALAPFAVMGGGEHLGYGSLVMAAGSALGIAVLQLGRGGGAICGGAFALGFAALTRPEGALLSLLLLMAMALAGVGKTAAQRFLWAVGLIGVIAIVLSFTPPSLLPRDVALRYLRFDAQSGGFLSSYAPWWRLNLVWVEQNLGIPVTAQENLEIFREIARHPFAFAVYAIRGGMSALESPAMTAFLLGVVVYFGLLRAWLSFAVFFAAMLSLAILFLVNPGLEERHSLCAVCVCMVAIISAIARSSSAVRWFRRRRGRGISLLACGVLYCSILAGIWHAAKERKRFDNTVYKNIAAAIAPHLPKGSLLACSAPELMAFLLDTPTVGNPRFALWLDTIVQRHRPGAILLDNSVHGDGNLRLFRKRYRDAATGVPAVSGYAEVASCLSCAPPWSLLVRR